MPRLVHFEIHADDLNRASKFYSEVFGWVIEPYPGMPDYFAVTTGNNTEAGINGGMIKRKGPPPQDGQPVNAFVCTMQIDNIDIYIEKIISAGGKIVVEKYALPGFAWLAYGKDTEGNIIGLYQEDKNAK